jgi:hypothetical protein
MKSFLLVSLSLLLFSCASSKDSFEPEKTCSDLSLKYIKNNKHKRYLQSQEIITALQGTQSGVQSCYDSFVKRKGKDEFNTCLVIGYDVKGKLDYWELSSKEAKLDQEFLNCSNKVIGQVPFWKYGKNFILVQSYHFYKD